MSHPEESIEQLKAQVSELSRKLQSLAQEKGQTLSDKTDGILDLLKKELEQKSSQPGSSPLKMAMAALALGLVQEFEPKVKESLKGAAEKSAGFAGQIEEGFSEGLDKTVAASRKAGASVVDYVKENPWKALAFAAVLGLLIGRAAPRDKAGDEQSGL